MPSRDDPAFRRWQEDVLIQVALGRFYADKLRAGVLFDLFRRTGNETAHERAVSAYRKARATWASMAERARSVYVADLTYGDVPVRRGHWLDRLPAIDQDLAAVEKARFDAKPDAHDRLNEAMTQASGRPLRLTVPCSHTPPGSYQSGKPVAVAVRVNGAPSSVTLRYRQVNQAERWQSVPMQKDGDVYRAVIPAGYTESPYALQHYFHLRQGQAAAVYPGFNEVFANQPYFVVARA